MNTEYLQDLVRKTRIYTDTISGINPSKHLSLHIYDDGSMANSYDVGYSGYYEEEIVSVTLNDIMGTDDDIFARATQVKNKLVLDAKMEEAKRKAIEVQQKDEADRKKYEELKAKYE